MFTTMPERRVSSRLSSTRRSIARNTAILRKRRLRSKSSWRKSTTRSACIPRLAIALLWSSSSLRRFHPLANEEPPHESNTQCEGQREQHAPTCDANSPQDRRGGGENVDFPDGESFPPGPRGCGWPAI